MDRGETLAARWLRGPQSITHYPVGFGFPHPAGKYRPGGSSFSSRGRSCCRDMECFTIRGRELILPDCGGTSTWARGENLAVPWLHGPQPISNYPVGFGFPHPVRRYRPEGSAFSSPDCLCCRDMEGFLTREWATILARCGGISTLARGEPLAAHWLRGPQPIIHHPVALGFPHPAGRYGPGGSAFSFPGFCRYEDMERLLIWRWKLILPRCRETSALARGATLAERWRHGPQSIRIHPVGLGIPHPAGRYRRGGSAFSAPGCSCNNDAEEF